MRKLLVGLVGIGLAVAGNGVYAQGAWTYDSSTKVIEQSSTGWKFNVAEVGSVGARELSVTNCAVAPGSVTALDFSGDINGTAGKYSIVNIANNMIGDDNVRVATSPSPTAS